MAPLRRSVCTPLVLEGGVQARTQCLATLIATCQKPTCKKGLHAKKAHMQKSPAKPGFEHHAQSVKLRALVPTTESTLLCACDASCDASWPCALR